MHRKKVMSNMWNYFFFQDIYRIVGKFYVSGGKSVSLLGRKKLKREKENRGYSEEKRRLDYRGGVNKEVLLKIVTVLRVFCLIYLSRINKIGGVC